MAIPFSDAMVLMTELETAISNVSMPPARREAWGALLVEVPDLIVGDVRTAIRELARRPWLSTSRRLEIADVIEGAKLAMRSRRLREAQDLDRRALEAPRVDRSPYGQIRARIAREVACDMVLKRLEVPDFYAEVNRRLAANG